MKKLSDYSYQSPFSKLVTDDFLNNVSLFEYYLDMLSYCKTVQKDNNLPIEAYNVLSQVAREIFLSKQKGAFTNGSK